MNHERDNLTAGLFVLAGLVLGIGMVFFLTDFNALFQKTQKVDVAYSLSDGLQGLKIGAEVSLGDEPIGSVVAIDNVEQDQRVTGKRVTIEIPARFKLRRDAAIELVVPPLGAGTRLNIRSVGAGEAYDGRQPIEGTLAGSLLTANLMRDAGIMDQQRQQIQQIIANVAQITETLKNDLPPLTAALREDIPAITARLREDVPQITASARRVLADAEPLAADARLAVASLKESLARVDTLLADKDQTLRETLDNVHAISAKVLPILDDARTSVQNIKVATGEVKALILMRRPHLEKMLANLQLTGEQLKLAAIEIRRSPWRLLYKPSRKELETDNLYDAARSFALAASVLDTTIQALRDIQQREPADEQQVAELVDYLEKLTGRFTEAEGQFWSALDDATH